MFGELYLLNRGRTLFILNTKLLYISAIQTIWSNNLILSKLRDYHMMTIMDYQVPDFMKQRDFSSFVWTKKEDWSEKCMSILSESNINFNILRVYREKDVSCISDIFVKCLEHFGLIILLLITFLWQQCSSGGWISKNNVWCELKGAK